MRSDPAGRERGAAVVDFVLVLMVLIPLFLGILQLTLVVLVRNTLAAAASEGARYAATLDRTPADGAAYTRAHIQGALAARFAEDVVAQPVLVHGAPGVEVRVRVVIPALGIGGPAIALTVSGHAIEEEQ
jgi:Flp pilus assembly protein TadG